MGQLARQGVPKPPDHGSDTGETLDIGVHQDAQSADHFRFRAGPANQRVIIFAKNLRQQPFPDTRTSGPIEYAGVIGSEANPPGVFLCGFIQPSLRCVGAGLLGKSDPR